MFVHSKIYSLALGSSRDFVLCKQSDFGSSEESDMSVVQSWPL